MSAAEADASAQGGGLSSQVLVGALILALGLTGLFGGAFAVTASRRRTAARVGGRR